MEFETLLAAAKPRTIPPPWQSWPATWRACISTYFRDARFGDPDEKPNRAAYMMGAVLAFEEAVNALHAAKGANRAAVDAAAAHELYFHHRRKTIFRNAPAALWACLQRLAIERPERILDRLAANHGRKNASST